MIYASTSLALVAIETFVHLEPNLQPDDSVSIACEVPDEIDTERLDARFRPFLDFVVKELDSCLWTELRNSGEYLPIIYLHWMVVFGGSAASRGLSFQSRIKRVFHDTGDRELTRKAFEKNLREAD